MFIPIGINYDRVIEDRSLVRKLDPDVRKRSTWFVTKTTLHFIYKQLLLSRRNRWRRFGYASVNFGKPLSVREYCAKENIEFSKLNHDDRFTEVGKLAEQLMRKIERVIPVLPVPLMSSVVLDSKDEWKSELQLKMLASERIDALRSKGALISVSSSACEGVLSAAMTMLLARGMLDAENGMFRANPDSIDILSYYANSIKTY